MNRHIVPLLAAAVLLMALAPTAAAHATKTSDDGKIKVTWGWKTEPASTYTLNALDLTIRDNATNAGIAGLEKAGLTVTLRYGEEALEIETLAAQSGKGNGTYTGPHAITPTRPGIYTLHVSGTIQGSEVDLEIPATHEMEDLRETMFPVRSSTTAELDAKIAELEAKIAALEAKSRTSSETPADVTPATGGRNPVPAPGALPALAVLAVATLVALRRRG